MILYRTFIQNIQCNFSIPENPNGSVIINCAGLPGQPENRDLHAFFNQEDFIFIHVKYEGTWESHGEFLDHSPAEDIITVVNYINKEHALKSAYDGSLIPLPFEKIFLLGSSFGASVALVATAKSTHIYGAIAIAPVIQFEAQGNGEFEEQNLTGLGAFLRNGYGRAYNFTPLNWDKLLKGEIDINPGSYIEELSQRKLLFIHGENDKTVSVKKTKDFYQKIENESTLLVIIPNAGHLNAKDVNDSMYVTEFLNK